MHVAVGFMPASRHLQKNSLIVFERGHKAHGYESAVDGAKTRVGYPPQGRAATYSANNRSASAPPSGLIYSGTLNPKTRQGYSCDAMPSWRTMRSSGAGPNCASIC